MKKIFFVLAFFCNTYLFSHSVQVQYCVSCSGDLRIWLEHWHAQWGEDPNSTTMTISITINGTTSTITSVPGGAVNNMTPGQLPGCSTPIIYVAGCPGEENTYNDWVYYDFPGLPANVPLSFTIISGNTAFTADGCGMYPLTVNFTLSTILSIDDQYICDGNVTDPVIMNNNATWTNSNPSIGLPASGTGTIPSFSPIVGTGASATISYSSTCSSGSFDYNISPPLDLSSLVSDYNGNNISCNGYNDGSIDLSTIGGSPPYIYSWNIGSGSEDLDSLFAGSYSVVVTDSNSCFLSDTITLTEPTPLQTAITTSTDYNGYNISCNGYSDGGIDLNVSGSVPGYAYLWSNGDTTQSISGLSSGIYSVNVIDSISCSVSTSISLIEPTLLEITYILSDINEYNVCNNSQDGFIDLSVSGSVPVYSYQWSNGDTIEDINGLSAGTYSYMVTDQNGCITSDTIEIIEPTINIQESAVDVSCFGATNGSVSVNVSGSTAPYYVFWNNNINTTLVSSGTYVYQIIDSIGCVYFDSLIVSEPDSFIVTESVIDVSCNGFNDASISLVISGATPPFVVNWFGANILNAQAGTYNYTIVDSNNCYFSEIAIVNEPNQIDVLNQVVDPSCGNTNDGSVSLQISGGTSPYSVDWGGSNPNSLGIGSYVFVVTDDNNCVDSNTVTLTSVSNIGVVSETTQISCNSFCDGSIDLTITGGVSPYAVDWFGVNPAFLCEGSVSYEIVDAVGCYYAENFQIISPDSVELSISQLGMQLEGNASGGVAPYSYEWFNDFGSLVNSQTVNITSNGSYYCIAIDVNHCQSDTVEYYYSETSIEDLGVANLNIYPNPTDNVLNIDFESVTENDFSLCFIDVLGQKIMIDRIEAFKGNYTYKLDLQRFAQGIYIFELRSGSEIYNKKVIKK